MDWREVGQYITGYLLDVKGILTALLIAFVTFLASQYLRVRRRQLISWVVLFDGPVAGTPGAGEPMWEVTRHGSALHEASLVVLDITSAGQNVTVAGDWAIPLEFHFPDREIIDCEVRDRESAARMAVPATAIDGSRLRFPPMALDPKQRFKVLVLLKPAPPGSGEAGGGSDAISADSWLRRLYLRLFPPGSLSQRVRARGTLNGAGTKDGGVRQQGRNQRRNQLFASGFGALLTLLVGPLIWLRLPAQEPDPTCATGIVSVAGSTAFAPIATSVAHEYESRCRGGSFVITADGSDQGWNDLVGDRNQYRIAMSDGPAGQQFSGGFEAHKVGVVFFAIVANSSLNLNTLSAGQLRDIFKDKPDGDYVAVGRSDGSGTRKAFEQKVLGPNRKAFPNSRPCPVPAAGSTSCTMGTTLDVLTYVNQNKRAIGYAEFDALSFFPNVNVVAIGGVLPTRPGVAKADYPFQATEYFYTVTGAADVTKYYTKLLTSHAMLAKLDNYNFVGCSELPGEECPDL